MENINCESAQKHAYMVNNVEGAKKAISDAYRIVILISTPDADSIGAGIVLKRHLRNIGKDIDLISGNLLFGNNGLPLIDEICFADPFYLVFSEYDLIITLDTANPYPQLVNSRIHESFQLPLNPPTLSIDHHIGNEGFAQFNIWEPGYSSTCEVIFKYFLSTITLISDEATLLLAGIIGDTGHFSWMTSPQTLKIAAMLMEMGGNLGRIVDLNSYKYDQKALETIRNWLDRIIYNDRMGYMAVTLQEHEIQDAGLSEAEFRQARAMFHSKFLPVVKGYPIGLFLVENAQTVKGHAFGNPFRNTIDLTQLSRLVGGNGGGHFNASGFVVKSSMEELFRKIDCAVSQLRTEDHSDVSQTFSEQ